MGPVGPSNPHEEFHVNLVRSLDDVDLPQSQEKRFWLTDFSESLSASEECMSLEDNESCVACWNNQEMSANKAKKFLIEPLTQQQLTRLAKESKLQCCLSAKP